MNHFRTRPNLSDLQFRQIQGSELNIYGRTILDIGEFRVKEDGDIILEGPIQDHTVGDPFIAADENGVLYKTYLDLSGITFIIYQPDHGFIVSDVVGFEEMPENPEDYPPKYTKAIADGSYPGEPLGLASNIIDKDHFVLMQVGFVDFYQDSQHQGHTEYGYDPESYFEPGRIYYLSDEIDGKMVLEPPTNPNSIKKPVFIPVYNKEDERSNLGWVLPYPPVKVSDIPQNKILTFIGDGETRDFTYYGLKNLEKHNLGTRNVMVQIHRKDEPFNTVYTKIERPFEDSIKIKFSTPPSDGVEYVAMIIGMY